jgi:hypothetical protein
VIGGWSTDATSLYAFVDDPSITAWDLRFDGGHRGRDDHSGRRASRGIPDRPTTTDPEEAQ